MTVHICRDFLTQAGSNPIRNNLYLTAIMLFHCGGFSIVGNTNMNIPSFVIASGTLSLSASISTSLGVTYVTLPTSSYVVTSTAAGKIISLRSSANPSFNSGLFRVSSTLTGSNALIIDYRSTDSAPVETSALSWILFQDESALVLNAGILSSSGGYRGMSTSTVNRVILQSPHSSSWQVRLGYEPTTLRSVGGLGSEAGIVVGASIAPGINGQSNGDFQTGSLDQSLGRTVQHLHGPMWFNVDSNTTSAGVNGTKYPGTLVGIDPGFAVTPTYNDLTATQHRYYCWVDNTIGTTVIANRDMSGATVGTPSTMCMFGLTQDEEVIPSSVVSSIMHRVFVFGTPGKLPSTRDLSWNNNPGDEFVGLTFGLFNKPVSAVISTFNYIGGKPGALDPWYETNAADSQYLLATELQIVDIVAGTRETNTSYTSWPSAVSFDYDPRRIGSLPLARLGRSNFSNWSVSTDTNKAWFHLKNGVYLQYSGPTPLP